MRLAKYVDSVLCFPVLAELRVWGKKEIGYTL
jgi:hypothetical protein